MKIRLTSPTTPHSPVLDTDAMDVEITEAFIGVMFVTADGSRLAVSMRDDGYEVHYWGEDFDAGWAEFKGGVLPQPAEEQA